MNHNHDEQHFTEDPGAMMAMHPGMYRWTQAAVMVFAAWLVSSPLTLGYSSRALVRSDVISGVVAFLIALVSLSVKMNRSWVAYLNVVTGLWLLFAPLVFWAPEASSYLNDTLLGALILAFSFVIPMGMKMPGPSVPRGWSYNPSTWVQRAPLIALGLVGFFLSRYMTAFQLGHIEHVWEPFFHPGTEAVLHSKVSQAWPVSDAGLGAATYMIEVLSTFMGDEKRWRTMPWMVAMFGIAVIPLGAVSIILIILQPLMVGTWCTLCLVSAAAMLLMIPLALDEVVAMIQFMNQSRKEGKPLLRVFIRGGTVKGASGEPRPDRKARWNLASSLWGVTASPALYVCAALGVWLMFSPAVYGASGMAADSDHLVGSLVVAISVISWAEVARWARFAILPLGLWLILASWFLSGSGAGAQINSFLVGLLVLALSFKLGTFRDTYGSYDKWMRWPRSRGGKTKTTLEAKEIYAHV